MTDGHVGQGDVPTLPPVLNKQEEVQLRRQKEEMRWTLKKHLFRSLVWLLMLEVNIVGVVKPRQPFDQAGWLQEVA